MPYGTFDTFKTLECLLNTLRWACVRAFVVFPKYSRSLLPHSWFELVMFNISFWLKTSWIKIYALDDKWLFISHTLKYLTSICIYFHVFGHRIGWTLVESDVLRFLFLRYLISSFSSFTRLFPKNFHCVPFVLPSSHCKFGQKKSKFVSFYFLHVYVWVKLDSSNIENGTCSVNESCQNYSTHS